MKRMFLKFTALLFVTVFLITCDKNKNNTNKTHVIEGLNAQPEQDVAPAPPIDSSSNPNNNNSTFDLNR